MRLNCNACGAQIPADDMNLERLVARCRACNSVFSFADEVEAKRDDKPAGPWSGALPSGIRTHIEGGTFVISRRWFSPIFLFLLFFCFLWDSFLVGWYATLGGVDGMHIVAYVFPLGHVVVGLGLSYWTLCGLINTTRIEVGAGRLRIKHQPLPWPGQQVIDVSHLRQLYCAEHVSKGKNGTTVTYEVYALTRGGKKIKLLGMLQTADQARFIEQKIEERLGMAHESIPGELRA